MITLHKIVVYINHLKIVILLKQKQYGADPAINELLLSAKSIQLYVSRGWADHYW